RRRSRRCRSCSSPVPTTSRPARCRSGSATAPRTTAFPSTMRSPGSFRQYMTEHEEQLGAGLRDRFERLYTPHRMAYISGEAKSDECPFCAIPGLPDEEGLVVHRGTVAYAVLNLFPYNSGHLMLVPYRHVSGY